MSKAALLAAVAMVAGAITARAAETVFDKPVETKSLTLPPEHKDEANVKVDCAYYPGFMVKKIDEGEVDAEQLSVVPIANGGKPACKRANVPTEKVVDPAAWGGYMEGAKGDFVFFTAGDGVNGALGFAVVAASDAKKLFDDAAVGDLHSLAIDGTHLAIRYRRSFAGSCSVQQKGAACWETIAAAAGLDVKAAPDCAAGYRAAKAEMAKARCDADGKKGPGCIAAALKELDHQGWDEAPSVVVYEAEAIIAADDPAKIRPLGQALSCQPSD